MSNKMALIAAGVALLTAEPSAAHFLSIYTPRTIIDEAATVPVELAFWHPLFTGEVMDLAPLEAFFVVHNGAETDLMDRLEPVTFTSWRNSGAAFRADVPTSTPGDYVLVAVPQPYFEPAEDIYIQQITKVFVISGGVATDWDKPVGLKAEIVPVNRPYGVFAGSTFTGVVLSDGEPVPGAEIEIEYIAAPIDVATHRTVGTPVDAPPLDAIITYTDGNGYFTFGIPRAGWWGFAALGVGPDEEFQGGALSQDAVIWVTASEFGG